MQTTKSKKHGSIATREQDYLFVKREVVEKQVMEALNTPQQVTKISKDGTERIVHVDPIGERQLISARELWLFCVGKGKPINWIESYKALLKYVSADYRDVFDPISNGTNSGTRYHVRVQSVIEFLFLFQNNRLKAKKPA